ncbi:MAG: PaaI family thioesterase [Oscillospiraceae bacterium]|nr:PaaI family thioesterase [Oscillospiraceae bacterium]
MKTLDEIREIFKNDRFATENFAVIEEAEEKYAKCSVKLTDRHRNAMGGVMGGVHFMLADFAFAVASNGQHMGVVSVSSNITFLSGVKGDILYAEARCVKDGRTTCYYTVDVYDDKGIKCAAVTITGCHVA